MGISISGNIQETPLTDVLESLRIMKATGTLLVVSGPVQKNLYLQEGKVVFASSSDVRDRLGEVMVRAGRLKRADLEQALESAKRMAGFKKLGAILVENGLVTPKELFEGLKLQIKEILFGIFTAAEGTYQFDKSIPADIIPLQINMQEVQKDAVMWKRMQK